jgi:hypothetical protein
MALQFSRNGLRAIIGGKPSDMKDEGGEAAESVFPIAIAVADGIVTELYKIALPAAPVVATLSQLARPRSATACWGVNLRRVEHGSDINLPG